MFSSESTQSADESAVGIFEIPLDASPVVTVWMMAPLASLRYSVSPALFSLRVPTSFSAITT